MKVLIAPTAFKGSLSPAAVAQAVADGLLRAATDGQLQLTLLPLADGGDGTIEAVHLAAGGTLHKQQVLGASGQPVVSSWLALPSGREALVELAGACGLSTLADGQKEPMHAHTYGLGQMILRAFEMGSETINIALGGSASTDGGMGALRALGVVFFDRQGKEISALGGAALGQVTDCDISGARWLTGKTHLRVLTDVDNPLLGAQGAAAIFAPQKGADTAQIQELESGLDQFSSVIQRCMNLELRTTAGAGAAGGTAFGLAACLGAELQSGFDWVAGATGLDAKLSAADLVISGEGRFDSQSLAGKVIGSLMRRCRSQDKPLWLVAGSAPGMEHTQGVDKLIVPEGSASDNRWCSASDVAAAVAEAWRLESSSLVQQ